MGYSIRVYTDQTRFLIPAKHHAAALAALKALPDTLRGIDHADLRAAPTLVDAIEVWRWEAKTNAAGDIIGIDIDHENLYHYEVYLFIALAPYVAEDSWIPCAGNDGEDFWAWWFHDGKCWEVPGAVVYDRSAAEALDLSDLKVD